jgi:hypothetical protein
MQYKLASISLLMASVVTAKFTSSPIPSSHSVTVTPSSTPVSSTTSIPSSTPVAIPSHTPGPENPEDFDCVYRGWGCNWTKSEYGYGSEYCGSSPFTAGQQLSDGNHIVAVSKDGSGDCASKAGNKCCQVLAETPCKYGEKYLECYKPE